MGELIKRMYRKALCTYTYLQMSKMPLKRHTTRGNGHGEADCGQQ